jgi:peptide/nickel transport system substrate-binding protein
VLKKPYPKLLLAVGKITPPCCFVMPARIAATDPFKQNSEYIGSGPIRFVRSDWVPGAAGTYITRAYTALIGSFRPVRSARRMAP